VSNTKQQMQFSSSKQDCSAVWYVGT